MIIPASIAGIFFCFNVVAPVNLHEWHAMLDKPPSQETRLPKARAPVTVGQLRAFLRHIKHPQRVRRGQKRKRLGAIIVDRALTAGIDTAASLIERLQENLAIL